MKLPWRRHKTSSRGQALVEFALMLPLLILVLLLAIDFGRVFFGWVALNNASRIAASEAGFHPEAWKGTGNVLLQDIYQQQVVDDMNAINCEAPGGGGAWTKADVPGPVFKDVPGTFSTDPYEVGDHAQVRLACNFSFLTPLVGSIVGDPLTIVATSEFPVKGGEIKGIPIGGPPPPPVVCTNKIVPTLVGQSVQAARAAWTGAGFTGSFNPASGFDLETVTAQVTSPASSPGGCLVATASVSVATQTACITPQLVGLKSSAGSSAFFSAGFTGTYTINRPPSNDYLIGSQSLVGGQVYLCNSSIKVFK
jgi:TadE-like protein